MGDVEQPQDEQIAVRIASSMEEIDPAEWDACAAGEAGGEAGEVRKSPPNPFISHAFFKALEDSGSASAPTGWLPQHLLFEDADGRVVGAMPCYLKSHSLGEYVFDHGWADAYERAGGSYYPKLQASVPFTPVTGPRLLAREGEDRTKSILLRAGATLTERYSASSLHLTFLTRGEWELAAKLGFLTRIDQQFHWRNENYGAFEDFLSALASRKRKAIRSERRRALSEGIEIEWISGPALTEAHWDAFFTFYSDTGARKWGTPYLTREFFSLIGQSMADRILLVMAKRAGRYIAGALNFAGADTLYGRYWGAIEDHDCLHFEVCYYQAIDYAIAHGLHTVEAGAQGGHKLARGYLPVTTYSAHWIRDPGFRRAVADYLKRERMAVAREGALLAEDSPYRRADEAASEFARRGEE